MANTYTQIIVHTVFSTKDRRQVLHPRCHDSLYAYIGGTIRTLGGKSIAVNGIEDHIHILTYMPKTLSVAAFVQKVKVSSSLWLADTGLAEGFDAWQTGYGAFSVDWLNVPRLKKYIDKQKAHHGKQSYQDELRQLLTEANVTYDETYLWT
jgi:putative transposase